MTLDTLEDHGLRRRVELALANHGDDHIASLTVRDIRALLQHAVDQREAGYRDGFDDGTAEEAKRSEEFIYTDEEMEKAAADAETEGYAKGFDAGRSQGYDEGYDARCAEGSPDQ